MHILDASNLDKSIKTRNWNNDNWIYRGLLMVDIPKPLHIKTDKNLLPEYVAEQP